MLSSLLSLPSAALSSTASFFVNRRRGFTYAVGAVGGAYLAGKWALERMGESAERSRREGWGRDDLARRFNLNLQDSHFTVLALLPTLEAQVRAEMDVEGRTGELGRRAREEREKRAREAAEAEEEERRRVEEAEREREKPYEVEEQPADVPTDAAAPLVDAPSAEPSDLSSSSTTLNPAAPAFVFNPSAPSFEPGAPSSATDFPSHAGPAGPSAPAAAEDFPPLAATTGAEEKEAASEQAETPAEQAEEPKEEEKKKKSWAAVAATEVLASRAEPEGVEKPPTPPTDPDTPPPSAPISAPSSAPSSAKKSELEVDVAQPDTTRATEDLVVPPEPEEPEPAAEEKDVEVNPLAEKSKAELWNEIKILSFTRLLTSLYLLTLLTLQTHVQLALLGRASYVDSLVSSLPPRTPSPPLGKKGKALFPDLLEEMKANGFAASGEAEDGADRDLEAALFAQQAVPLTTAEEREEERKDVERKYLTFSWWLLHEGWKVVEERVRAKVEEVVGPMGLKTPLVYGELGALFGQLRRKIEIDETTGKPFDFSAALHPPTPAFELQTLIFGGSYVPSPPSSSSSHSSSSTAFPPRPSPRPRDPISPALRRLLEETSDALDSPDAALVRSLALDRLFSLVIERLEPSFRSTSSAGDVGEGGARGARFEDVTEKTARLAGVLPALTRLTGEGGVLGSGGEWVEALSSLHELRSFAAVLYGSWDRDDLRRSCVV
ncbi:hypothetical protein JCM8097_000880 [Rhodosporidiobolus ruineniae]